MISTSNVTLRVGKKALFEDVSIKFIEGNCYGLIGANGAGKSTFLRILSGQLEPTNGEVIITPGQRLSFLQQDHFKYDAYPVLDTVIMGNARLYEIMKEKEAIYMKEDFSEEDGVKAAELEGEFATMNGWEAESDAANLLNGLGIETDLHYKQMADLTGAQKVKVLLAQALFGNPDILLLDEPTNHLDLDAIAWLEEFLINFENTVIVVSHDRYFLNKVCTQIADIDYGKIQLYAGNYDFWYESSQLMIKQMKEANKKKEEKIKELQEFIQRFSANASKSKQATSRKRALEKIELDEIKPSSRKYPYIDFRPEREIGNEVLSVENLSKTIDGVKVLDNISFILGREDKVAFVGPNEQAKTVLFKILSGEMEPDEGSYKWGLTTSQAYFPKDNSKEFDNDDTIVDWLTQYSPVKDVTYVRGFLGRMLFAGEDGVKKVRVLSGVDSSVAGVLMSKAIGDQLTCVFVEHGLLRKNEGDEVEAVFGPNGPYKLNFIRVNAQQRFYDKLAGVTDPERKRKIIGEEFIRVFEEEAKKIGKVDYFVQGTIYPDVIESGLGKSAVIKSHHNVGGLPEHVDFKEIIEPLRMLFKDEVRRAGLELGIPENLVYRQPFPGPGLGVRIIGEVTAEKVRIVQDADAIYREEIAKAGIDRTLGQYFAALTNMRSVGCMGDVRTYDYAIALRAVLTSDFMTAESAELPWEVLGKVTSRIVNEVKGVNRVLYDCTGKPPATIEFE